MATRCRGIMELKSSSRKPGQFERIVQDLTALSLSMLTVLPCPCRSSLLRRFDDLLLICLCYSSTLTRIGKSKDTRPLAKSCEMTYDLSGRLRFHDLHSYKHILSQPRTIFTGLLAPMDLPTPLLSVTLPYWFSSRF